MKLIKSLWLAGGVLVLAASFLFAQSQTPVIEFRAEPVYFSPNADDLQDNTFFYPVIRKNGNGDVEINRWRLNIRKPTGKRIQKLNGAGLPSLIKWDGQTKKEETAPEGKYNGTLIIWGRKFKVASSPVSVYVDNTPPVSSLSIPNPHFQMNADGFDVMVFEIGVEDKSPIAEWQLQILDVRGRSIRVFSGTDPVDQLEWDGTDQNTGVLVPKGEYRAAFVAWDAAGNESVPVFAEMTVEVSTQQMLEQVLNYITVFETDLGLIVQLPAAEIFDVVDGKPELKIDEDMILKEVAILINAYPDVPVQLDGYSFTFKKAAKDKDRSSRYAWKVYSHLVKKGNVKASRLKVRGRGRSPMFERREADDPPDLVVVKNGVEVILIGDRDWSE